MKAFEPGQAYVGLSRCRSLDGLQVLGDSLEGMRRAIRCCPTVAAFHRIVVQTWEHDWNKRRRAGEVKADGEEGEEEDKTEGEGVQEEVKSAYFVDLQGS